MKTLAKLSVVAALASAAISYAGPGPQFWNRPATKAAPSKIEAAAAVSQMPTKADSSGLSCARMLVPRVGAFKQSPVSVVTCTPEMMKADWRCQQACAAAAKGYVPTRTGTVRQRRRGSARRPDVEKLFPLVVAPPRRPETASA